MPQRFAALSIDGNHTIFEVSASSGTLEGTVFRDNTGAELLVINAVTGTVSAPKGISSSTQISVSDTSVSTSPTTGALVVGGGLGVSGDIYTGGILVIGSTVDAIDTSSGAVRIAGGLSVAKHAYFGELVHAVSGADLHNQRMVNLGTPTLPTDAVTKEYVDSYVNGMSVKQSVSAGTTGPVTLATGVVVGSVIDGITLVAGDRVLVKNQTDPIENGVYVVSSGGLAPVRSADFAVGMDVSGSYIFVEAGTLNRSNAWIVVGSTVLVGTDPISLFQFTSTGDIVAGDAMIKTGNRLDVVADGVSLEVSGDALRIASGAAGTGLSGGGGAALSVNANLSHVTGLGVVSSGTWQGSVVGVAYGGTGASSFGSGNVLFGNGTGALGTSSGLVWSGGALTADRIVSSGRLVAGNSGAIEGALGSGGSVFHVAGVTFTDTSSPETSVVSAFRGAVVDRSTFSPVNAGVVVSDASSLFIAGTPIAGGTSSFTRSWSLLVGDGAVGVMSTAVASTSTSGALVVAGGVGVGGSIVVAGGVTVGGSGGLVVNDAGAGRGIVVGPSGNNALYFDKNHDGVVTDRTSVYAFDTFQVFTGGLIGNQVSRLTIGSSGVVTVQATTGSTGSSNGALVVAGGVGIAERLNVGGRVVVSSTVASSGVTSGAVVVSGGIGVGGDAYVGGTLGLFLPSASRGVVLGTSDGVLVSRGAIVSDVGRWNMRLTGGVLDVGIASGDVVGSAFTVSSYGSGGALTGKWFEVAGADGIVTVWATNEASAIGVGALVVGGGISAEGNVVVGGSVVVGDVGMTIGDSGEAGIGIDAGSGDLVIENTAGGIQLNAVGDVVITTSGVSTFTGGIGGSRVVAGGNYTGVGLLGQYFYVGAYTTTLTGNTGSFAFADIEKSTVAGDVGGRTVTHASTLRIAGAPVTGANVTVGDAWALRVSDGRVWLGSTVDSSGVGSSASLMIAGGVSIGKTLWANSVSLPASDTFYTRFGNVAIARALGGDSVLANFIQSGNTAWDARSPLRFTGPDSVVSVFGVENDHVLVSFTDDASAGDTGGLRVRGGMSVDKSVYVGGRLVLNPVSTYYNDNPAFIIDSGATMQNLDVGGLMLRVYEQADVVGTFGSTFSGRQIMQTTTVSVDYTSPAWKLNDNTASTVTAPFAARFQGYIKPAYAEVYTVYLTVQGGARVYIDGTPVVVSWEQNATATLHVGQFTFSSTSRWLPIVIEWATTSSPSRLLLEWSSTTQARQTVPASALAYSAHESAGSVYGTVNVYGPAAFSEGVSLKVTTESSGAGTGALSVLGGGSFSKNVFVGGYLNFNNARFFSGASGASVQGVGTTGTAWDISPPVGGTQSSVVRTFEQTIGPNINWLEMGWDGVSSHRLWSRRSAAGTLRPLSIGVENTGLGKLVADVDGNFTITSTTGSTGVGNGALVVAGGVSVAGNLSVGGTVSGNFVNGGFEFTLGTADQTTRGDTGLSRALVKWTGGVLVLNYLGDFYGGVRVDSDMTVVGNSTVGGGLGVSDGITISGGPLVLGTVPLVVKGTVPSGGVTDLGLYASSAVGENVRFVTDAGTFSWYRDGAGGTSASMTLGTSLSVGVGVSVTSTAVAVSSSNGGALTVAGGGAFGGSLYLGGAVNAVGGNFSGDLVVSSTAVSTGTGSGAVRVAGGLGVVGDAYFGGVVAPLNTVAFQGSTPVVDFGAGSVGTPTFTTRSAGTKVVLYSAIGASSGDYGFGVSSGVLWSSVPTTSQAHVMYAGTSEIFRVSGDGGIVSTGNASRIDFRGVAGAGGSVRISPSVSGTESSIGFYKDATYTGSAGDYWIVGKGAWGTLSTTFSIGTTGLNNVFSIQNSGRVVVNGTTDSTSSVTGIFNVSGGAGIAKALYVGGGTFLTGSLTLDNTAVINFKNAGGTPVPIVAIDASNNVSVNSAGGSFFNLNSGDGTTVTRINYDTTAGTIVYYGTNATVTAGNGSFVVNSGGTFGVTDGVATFGNTLDASSGSTGAVRIGGGIGVTKTVWAGNGVVVPYLSGSAQVSLTGNSSEIGSLLVNGSGNLVLGGTVGSIVLEKSVVGVSTAESTSVSTGGLVVGGGVGVAKSIVVGDGASFGALGRSTWSLVNASASDRVWYYLGKVNDVGGVGQVDLVVSGVRDVTVGGGFDSTVLNFGAKVNGASIVASHDWEGNGWDIAGGVGHNVVVYDDGSSNFHLFVQLSTGTKSQLDFLIFTNGSNKPVSEGVGLAPSGSASGYTGTWTVAYTTASPATRAVRSGRLLLDVTTDATSSSSGGALTVAGGLAVSKKLFVGDSLRANVVGSIGGVTPLEVQFNGSTRLSLTSGGGVTVSGGLFASGSGIDIGTSGTPFRNLYISGPLALTNTDISSSVSTGSLVLGGGLGVAGSTWIGGELHVGNSALLDGIGIGGGADAGYTTVSRVGGGTWYVKDNLGVERGLVVYGSSNVGGGSGAPSLGAGTSLTVVSAGWQDTTTSASGTASGGVVGSWFGRTTLSATSASVTTPLAASVWIEGDPIAGTNQTITNGWSLYVKNGRSWFGDTRDATSGVNGAVVLGGGLSVGKTVWSNKLSLPVGGVSDTLDMYSLTGGGVTSQVFRAYTENTGAVWSFVHSNLGGGDKTVFSISRAGVSFNDAVVSVSSTTVSSAVSSGALVVAGGVGIGGALRVGGIGYFGAGIVNEGSVISLGAGSISSGRALEKVSTTLVLNSGGDFAGGVDVQSGLKVSSTLDSASSSVGAMVVAGGLSVGKKVRVYDTLFVDISSGAGASATGASVAIGNTTAWSMDSDIGIGNRHLGLVSTASGGVVGMTMRNTLGARYWDFTVGGAGDTLAWTSVPQAGGSGVTYMTLDSGTGLLSLRGTADATDVSTGGVFAVGGGMRVSKSSFFGGDMTLTKTVNGGVGMTVMNTSNGTGAWSQLLLRNDTANVGMLMYNSSGRTVEGGASAMTMRNNGGPLLLQSSGGNGITISATTGAVTTSGDFTVGGNGFVTGYATVDGDVNVGGGLVLSGSTSGTTTLVSPAVAGDVSFVLPDSLPPQANASLIVTLSGEIIYGEPLPVAGTPSGTTTSTFNGANNVSSFSNINGLSFSGGVFMILVKVDVTATVSKTAGYELRGVYMPSGSWDFIYSAIGDDIGITFDITPAGQVRYTSPNFAGWTSTVFSWVEEITGGEVINVLRIGDNLNADYVATQGAYLDVKTGTTFLDKTTADNSTLSRWSSTRIGQSTLGGWNNNVTTTVASSVFIEGAPLQGVNQTIVERRALDVGNGKVFFGDTTESSAVGNGSVVVSGGASVAKNLHVGGDAVLASLKVGSAGTAVDVVLQGSTVVGASGSALKTVSITFGTTLSSTDYVLTGTVNTPNASSSSWVVNFVSLTTTGATANVYILSGSSWVDTDLRVDWRLTL